jgi:hypothetical protein
VLCDVKVAIVIVDKNEKVTVCSSVKDVDGFIEKYVKNLKEGAKEMIFSSNVLFLLNISTMSSLYTTPKSPNLLKQANTTLKNT